MKFAFVGGNLALDFVATVASRDTIAEERLSRPQDLAEWLVLSGAVTAPPSVSGAELTQAKSLREVLYRALRDREGGRPVDERTVEVINAAAASATPIPRLAMGAITRRGSVEAALALIARDAQAALIDQRLRFCDGADCTRPFLDLSRGRTRRWCGMAGCGDRAKAAAYRRRSSGQAAHRPVGGF